MEKTFRTMLHGFMKSHTGLKNMCKKTRKTSAGQSSMAANHMGSPHVRPCPERALDSAQWGSEYLTSCLWLLWSALTCSNPVDPRF